MSNGFYGVSRSAIGAIAFGLLTSAAVAQTPPAPTVDLTKPAASASVATAGAGLARGIAGIPVAKPAAMSASMKKKLAAGAKPAKLAKIAARPAPKASVVTAASMPPVKKLKKGKSRIVGVPPKPVPLSAIEGMKEPVAADAGNGVVEAIWNTKLLGNSISGIFDGQQLVEGYLPDGTVRSLVGGQVMQGRWGLRDGKICFQYAGEAVAVCYNVSVADQDVAYTAPDGAVSHFLLEQGIAPGL